MLLTVLLLREVHPVLIAVLGREKQTVMNENLLFAAASSLTGTSLCGYLN